MATWIISFSRFEKTPAAKQLAARIVSIVTLTRTALIHTAPNLRRELLSDLAIYEDIRVYIREPTDLVKDIDHSTLMILTRENVVNSLGKNTQFASAVNHIPGVWISFEIESDDFWIKLDHRRLFHTSKLQWLSWSVLALGLSLFGSALLTRLINRPLVLLTAAARSVAQGKTPSPLPEIGSAEIIEANRNFNQMVSDIRRIESDRELILAGISHDLRTPLARLQIEIEMADLSEKTRLGMHSDIAQIDSIIKQFLDYSKPAEYQILNFVDLSMILKETCLDATIHQNVIINSHIESDLIVFGNEVEFRRVFSNLFENARRYGKTQGSNITEIDLTCSTQLINGASCVLLEFRDHGIGIPESQMERLMRPFTRLDTSRSQANGAGLGLAIINRILQRYKVGLHMLNHPQGGLVFKMSFNLNLHSAS